MLLAIIGLFAGALNAGVVEASCLTNPTTTADLISAINCANSNGAGTNDVITLTTNGTYTLTAVDNVGATTGNNGLPIIADAATAGTLTINGNGATITRSSAGGTPNFRILEVGSGGNLAIDGVTISNGNAANWGGGILNFLGTVTISNSTFSGNSAVTYGGGVYNGGTMIVRSSTFTNNSADGAGGGGFISQGTATVINSTFSGNSSIDNVGGGIENLSGTLTITNSTLTTNSASYGGGLFVYNGTVALNNTIVSHSIGGVDCSVSSGTLTAQYSLVQDGSCSVVSGVNGNLTGDPLLDPAGLQNNGGSTLTIALQTGSPAIDAGSSTLALDQNGDPLTTDQRGTGYPRIVGSAVDMGAYESASVCPTFPYSVPDGDTASLINAINCANSNGAGTNDVITLTTNGTYILTAVDNVDPGFGLNGLPEIADASLAGTLTINGNGATIVRDSANDTPDFRILMIAYNGNLTLDHLNLRNGNVIDYGGGIVNKGTLLLTGSTVSENTAAEGAGIVNVRMLTIVNSTISSNSDLTGGDGGDGGGIYNASGTLLTINSTISANTAGYGGGIYNDLNGALTIVNTTISSNSATHTAGGIFNSSGILTLTNTIIADSTSGGDCTNNSGASVTAKYSLIEDNTNNCGVTNGSNGNIVGQDPLLDLAGLQNNGGSTLTIALQTGSPAIDAGSSTLALDQNGDPLTTDQRGAGYPRILGSAVDMGAYEASATCPTFPYSVADGDTASLINAINCANSNGAGTNDVITLTTNGTYILTAVNNTDASYGPNGLPVILSAATSGTLTIYGNGATIERSSAGGTPGFRILRVDSGGNLTLDHVTINNGNLPTDEGAQYGGGIFNTGGTLTVTDSTISNNTAPNDGGGINSGGSLTVIRTLFSGNTAGQTGLSGNGLGGGILVGYGTATVTDSTFTGNVSWGFAGGSGILNGGFSTSTLTVSNSTFSNNTADGGGGGIFNSGNGTLTLTNSTIANNTAYDGGGLWNSGTMTVTNTTISGNTTLGGGDGGGIYAPAGTLNLGSTIVAANTTSASGPDISGTVNSLGYNLIGSTSGGTITGDTTGNLIDGAASPLNLGLLQNNGGTTQTMALETGSVAINAGDPAFAPPPADDQRGAGFPRVVGGRIDIGAFEGTVATTRLLQVDTTSDADLANCTTAPNDCSLRGAIEFANAQPGAQTITFDPAVFASAQTILLNSALPQINGDVTIMGPGASLAAVDGANQYQVFNIASGAVTISGLTITHGRTDYGGGINNNGTLTLSDSTISNNHATQSGGGIISSGSLTVTNDTFTSNSTDADGGGIDIYGNNTLSVTNSTLTSNSAADSGGGIISLDTVTMTITDSSFSGNSAGQGGGGINAPGNSGHTTVTHSTFSGNSATYGGGISSGGTLSMTNSTITNNTATNSGAGISSSGSLTVSSTNITGNQAAQNGGGIIHGGTISVSDSTISSNTAGIDGGGLDVYNSTLTVTNTMFQNNSAVDSGGGIASLDTVTMTITDGSFSGNSAGQAGGGILIGGNAGNATIIHSTFSNNSAVYGGGISNSVTLTVTNSTVTNNTATNSGGGISSGGSLTISGTTITGNQAAVNGGGIVHGGTISVSDSTISSNTAGNDGGGLDFFGGSTLTLTNTEITNNSAGGGGGGVVNYDSTMTATGSTFDGNLANTVGGGIAVNGNDSTATVLDSTFSNNWAGVNGGGIQTYLGTLIVTNSTFSNNSVTTEYSSGGAINNNNGVVTVNDSTLSGSSAVYGGGIDNNGTTTLNNTIIANSTSGGDCLSSSGLTISHSLIMDGSCGVGMGPTYANGNLSGDPLLEALTGSPAYLPLDPNSPAINAGDNSLLSEATLGVDLNGDGDLLDTLTTDETGGARILFSIVDMGAYEATSVALGITTQPQSQSIFSGQTATLSVDASGASLSYQWYRGTSGDTSHRISEATDASYTTPALTVTTSYWVRVSNSAGTVNSDSATVTVLPAPTITTEPLSQSIFKGQTADLSVVASGSGLHYQWYLGSKNDTSTPVGADSASYTTPALTVLTRFWVQVTNLSGSDKSSTTTITLLPAPSITTQPLSQSIFKGQTADLSVVASGSTLSYQWYQGSKSDTSTPVGADSASYTTPVLTVTTRFWVQVTNPSGSASSATTTITVQPAPHINSQPQSQTIFSGQTADLSVVASGASLSYQWYQGSGGDTSTPVGANDASYTTPALTTTTHYWVRVTNPAGSVSSATATITVQPAPSITHQPASQSIFTGQTAALSVTASGASLSYQWYHGSSGDTSSPVGTDSASYTTPALTSSTSYWVRVTNPSGSADSTAATVTVQPAPSITTQPASKTIYNGQTATLSVTASGASLSYQWYQGSSGDMSTPMSGATSRTFTTPALTISMTYWVRVTNPGGSADSTAATVTVRPAPSITTQPADKTIYAGQTALLSVTASGYSLSYQWYQGLSGDTSTPMSGATSHSFTTPALSSTTTYWVRVTNPGGSADSTAATVTVQPAPTITTQPPSPAINSGKTAHLSVVASGASLHYQWYLGISGDTSAPVSGATGSSYTTPALSSDANYWVRVTNPSGSVDSLTAVVTVLSVPAISVQPQSQSIASGDSVTLTVTASGGNLAYQWYQGASGVTSMPVGSNSAGFTTPALTSDTSYWVKVSNTRGSASSDTAVISIITPPGGANRQSEGNSLVEPPSITSQPQNVTSVAGFTTLLSMTASGSDLSYQWYQGLSGDTSAAIDGATDASYTTPALTSDASYWVRVSNSAGSADSDTATVTVQGAPVTETAPSETEQAPEPTVTPPSETEQAPEPTTTPEQPQATHLAFVQQPGDVTSGSAIAPAITVELHDDNDFPVLADGVPVTLALASNPSGATLGGTLTVTSVGGLATFSNVSLDQAGSGYTLTASADGLGDATSSPFNVSAAPIVPGALSFVSGTPPYQVAEGAAMGDSFSFTLNQQPSADVTVTVMSADPANLLLVDPDQLPNIALVPQVSVTFHADDSDSTNAVLGWNEAATIDLSGVADDLPEGVENTQVTFVVSSADPNFNGISVPAQAVQVYDAGVVVQPSTSFSVAEGGSIQYQISLSAPPGRSADGSSETVTISLTADNPALASVQPAALTFTRDNWSVPQTVTVTASDDDVFTAAQYPVNVVETVSSDSGLNSAYGTTVAAPTVTITVSDNDAPPEQITPPPDNNSTSGDSSPAATPDSTETPSG